jgi:hypothetical protein
MFNLRMNSMLLISLYLVRIRVEASALSLHALVYPLAHALREDTYLRCEACCNHIKHPASHGRTRQGCGVKHCLTLGEELHWAMKDDSRLHADQFHGRC